jgi:hypothetical protein
VIIRQAFEADRKLKKLMLKYLKIFLCYAISIYITPKT